MISKFTKLQRPAAVNTSPPNASLKKSSKSTKEQEELLHDAKLASSGYFPLADRDFVRSNNPENSEFKSYEFA